MPEAGNLLHKRILKHLWSKTSGWQRCINKSLVNNLLRVKSVFHVTLWIFKTWTLLVFKAGCSLVHLHSAAPLDLGAQCKTWSPHSLGCTFAIVIVLLFVGHQPRGVLTRLHLKLSYFSNGSFFMSLVMEKFFG